METVLHRLSECWESCCWSFESLIARLEMRLCLCELLPLQLVSLCTADLHVAQPSRSFM